MSIVDPNKSHYGGSGGLKICFFNLFIFLIRLIITILPSLLDSAEFSIT